uniref:NADH-ubiquinone oxidoreductase chain 5 n=1 Tax=Iwatanemertes piperata TaxID=1432319 RepID=W5RSF2_9BILA|nr:NADH dehydrogenase subunit 5 [Iwatanemertes piperata]AHB53112.1 NADH dehydrogenase subunit 5 [Iwatanemertes piperata]
MVWWKYSVSSVLSLLMYVSFFFFLIVLGYLVVFDVCVFVVWEIVVVGSSEVGFNLVLDWISVSFCCVVMLISGSVLWFSSEYMAGDPFLPRFSWLVFLFVLSMNFVIFVPNVISVLLGWDGLGLVSFVLVVYYQNYKSLGAGLVTVLMNRVGDVMILLSIGWLCYNGSWNIFYLHLDNGMSFFVCVCILVAGMTKSAQVPFSSWLPAAMAAPTPVSALVHSSTLVTAGVYLLIRFYSFLVLHSFFKVILLLVAVVTMFMAGIAANLEQDLKKIIALSTLSQLGVMMCALGLGAWKLALFHLYTHALFKALLFLCAGALIHRSQHSQDLRLGGMIWDQVPVFTSCLHVANMALCGAPFLAGFYSKDAILESSLFGGGSALLLLMFFFATGMTVSYSLRLSYWALWGSNNFYSLHNWGGERVQEVAPMVILVMGAVFGGSLFMWVFFYDSHVNVLSVFFKCMTLVVSVMGGVGGWLLSSASNCGVKKDVRRFLVSYFGLVYMWFLVEISSQGVVKDFLNVGYISLYLCDRGWEEFFGGEGSFLLVSRLSRGLQEYGHNSIMGYVSIIVFLLFCWCALLVVMLF